MPILAEMKSNVDKAVLIACVAVLIVLRVLWLHVSNSYLLREEVFVFS